MDWIYSRFCLLFFHWSGIKTMPTSSGLFSSPFCANWRFFLSLVNVVQKLFDGPKGIHDNIQNHGKVEKDLKNAWKKGRFSWNWLVCLLHDNVETGNIGKCIFELFLFKQRFFGMRRHLMVYGISFQIDLHASNSHYSKNS